MQLELTNNERLLLIFALGAVANVPPIIAYKSEDPADPLQLAGRIVSLGDGNRPSNPPTLNPAAIVTNEPRPQPVQAPITWWAKGFPGDKPDLLENIAVTPSKIERKPTADGKPRLMVTWQNPNKGFSRASIWDGPLFAKVEDRENQLTTFFITRKGQWVNIVGVRH